MATPITTQVSLFDPGPPRRVEVTIQSDEGLGEVLVTESGNADTVVPPFIVGTSDPLVLTSTTIDQTLPSQIDFSVTTLLDTVREYVVTFEQTGFTLFDPDARSPVPEPGGLALLLVGLAGLGWIRRRPFSSRARLGSSQG